MAIMKQIFSIAISLLIFIHADCQKNCQLEKLSKESKEELIRFWDSFRESVAQKDTIKLLNLCDFPFRVSAEILSNKRDISENYYLDSASIMKYTTLMFFEKQFTESLLTSSNPIENLRFHGNLNKKHRTCVYEYFYLIKDKNEKEQLRSFSIVRIDSSYKIVSNWIRY
jgi:hypothetical protein